VTKHGTQLLAGLDVPKLYVTIAGCNAKEHPVVGEVEGRDVGVMRGIGEVGDSAGVGAPEVGGGLEGDGEGVERGPGEDVEVEVVDDVGGVKDALWLGREAAGFRGLGANGGGERGRASI
jgi:hypothetical protein